MISRFVGRLGGVLACAVVAACSASQPATPSNTGPEELNYTRQMPTIATGDLAARGTVASSSDQTSFDFKRAACRLNGTHDGVPIDIRHHWIARRGLRRGIHTAGRPTPGRMACHRLRPWNRWGNPRLWANRGFPPARRHHFGGDTAQARLRGGIHRLRGSGPARRVKPGRGDIPCLPGAKVGRVQPHRRGASRPRGGAAAVVALGGIGIVAGRRDRLGGRRIFCGLRAGHRSAWRRGAGSHGGHGRTGAAGRILDVDQRPDVPVPECDRGFGVGRQDNRSERLPARRSTRR